MSVDIHISVKSLGSADPLEVDRTFTTGLDETSSRGIDVSLNGSEVVLVCINGELDTNSSGQLEGALVKVLGSGGRRLLLDLTEMDYVSSVGLRVLLATLKKLKAEQGRLLLVGLNPEVREIFDMAGFSSLFEIAASLEEAWAVLAR